MARVSANLLDRACNSAPGHFLIARLRLLAPLLSKNNPQAGAQRLGAYSERAHWGEGTPEISMAPEYNT